MIFVGIDIAKDKHGCFITNSDGKIFVASAHLTRLTNLLSEPSKGHFDKDTAIHFREAAKNSIGSVMPAKSLEMKHTIKPEHSWLAK